MRERIIDDLTHPNRNVRLRAALNATDEKTLHDFASDSYWLIRVVAASRTLNPRLVGMLATDLHWYVRRVAEQRFDSVSYIATLPEPELKRPKDPEFTNLDDLRDCMRRSLAKALGPEYLDSIGVAAADLEHLAVPENGPPQSSATFESSDSAGQLIQLDFPIRR